MGQAKISVPKEMVAEFCRRNHIRKLSIFGSFLREDYGPESDIDLLVEFEPGSPVGFFGLARLERELTAILGRKVDLRTPAELSPHFREEVLCTSVVEYAEG